MLAQIKRSNIVIATFIASSVGFHCKIFPSELRRFADLSRLSQLQPLVVSFTVKHQTSFMSHHIAGSIIALSPTIN